MRYKENIPESFESRLVGKVAYIYELGASGGHGNGKQLTANASNRSERAEQIKEQYRIPLRKYKTSFQTLKGAAVIIGCGAVEAETISKTRAILKSHKSKGNLKLHEYEESICNVSSGIIKQFRFQFL